MNVALRSPMSVAEFLDWEDRQPTKYEFDGFRPVAMADGTAALAAIRMNLAAALVTRLRGKPCRPYSSDLKISVAGRIRYPDAQVVCTPVSAGTKVISDPVVVFEVLNPGSEHEDLVVKNEEYRAAPSIKHYVVLEQSYAGLLLFSRKGEDWIAEASSGGDAVLRLPAIGIEMKLSELYDGVPLAPEQDED